MSEVSYPLPVFHFLVDWGGTKGEFTEVSGLNFEANVIEYRHGLSPQYSTIKMPGMQSNGPITCRRGVFKGDNEFFQWWKSINLNKVERRNITISLLDETHEPVITWQVRNAWPSKVEGPSLNAQGDEIAMESLELAHEGIECV